jgi:hypothetical protein
MSDQKKEMSTGTIIAITVSITIILFILFVLTGVDAMFLPAILLFMNTN